jgi:hypothetical protein
MVVNISVTCIILFILVRMWDDKLSLVKDIYSGF